MEHIKPSMLPDEMNVGAAITTPIKGGIKAGVKVAAKSAAKKAAATAAKLGIKEGVKAVGKGFAKATGKVCVFACLPKGTKIYTEKELRTIENIRERDLVWSWDEKTGKKSLKKVVATHKTKVDVIIELHTIDGEIIKTTPTHPFKTDGEWKDAIDLNEGDILRTFDESGLRISKILHVPAQEKVYNFHIEDFHTYYIGENLILVHNACDDNIKKVVKKIVVDKKDKISKKLLNKPTKRGNAPKFKKDGTSVEIHHKGQNPEGPFKELHWKDHRGKGVDKINHPNKAKPSKIDRRKWKKQREDYWKDEYDNW